jgi:hypothetical protein
MNKIVFNKHNYIQSHFATRSDNEPLAAILFCLCCPSVVAWVLRGSGGAWRHRAASGSGGGGGVGVAKATPDPEMTLPPLQTSGGQQPPDLSAATAATVSNPAATKTTASRTLQSPPRPAAPTSAGSREVVPLLTT